MCHLFTHLVRNVIFIRKFCLCISHFSYSLLSKPRISTESTNWETRLKFTILAQLGRCSAKIQKPNSKPIFGIKSNALNLILCDEKNSQMNLQLDSPLTVFALLLSPLVYWWEIIKIFFSVFFFSFFDFFDFIVFKIHQKCSVYTWHSRETHQLQNKFDFADRIFDDLFSKFTLRGLRFPPHIWSRSNVTNTHRNPEILLTYRS